MSEVMGSTMEKAIDGLGKANDSLYEASNSAVGVLNAIGMTGTASTVKSAAHQTHQTSQSAMQAGANSNQNFLEVLKTYQMIIPFLEDHFAPTLAELKGFVIELKGMQNENWEGAGADAYKECANLQVEASSELSANSLVVAKVLREYKSTMEAYNHTIELSILAMGISIVTGIAEMATGVGAGPGVLTMLAGIGGAIGYINTFQSTVDTKNAQLRSELSDLKSAKSSGGSTVFPGHWPSRGELYSG